MNNNKVSKLNTIPNYKSSWGFFLPLANPAIRYKLFAFKLFYKALAGASAGRSDRARKNKPSICIGFSLLSGLTIAT
jgi:hypothetical protein